LASPEVTAAAGWPGVAVLAISAASIDRAVVVVQQRRVARREFLVAGEHGAGGAVERDVRQLRADRGRQRGDQVPQRLAPDAGAFVVLQRAEVARVLGNNGAVGVDDAGARAAGAEIDSEKIQG
jgi:hypothetical protein